MLILSTFKEPTDATANALRSWLMLMPRKILLFGEECEPAAHLPCVKVRHVQRWHGVPLVSDMIRQGEEMSQTGEHLLFVNSDIMIEPSGFWKARDALDEDSMLIVGRRCDLDVKGRINFVRGTWMQLAIRALSRGKLLSPCGCDWFLFRPGLWEDFPPFAIGRCSYDQWMIWDAKKRGKKIADATRSVLAIHQNHAESPDARLGEMAERNRALAEQSHDDWTPWKGWVSEAHVKL